MTYLLGNLLRTLIRVIFLVYFHVVFSLFLFFLGLLILFLCTILPSFNNIFFYGEKKLKSNIKIPLDFGFICKLPTKFKKRAIDLLNFTNGRSSPLQGVKCTPRRVSLVCDTRLVVPFVKFNDQWYSF